MILKLLIVQTKEYYTFWNNLYLNSFKRKYLVLCLYLLIKGLRVIDEEVIQEMGKINDDKS